VNNAHFLQEMKYSIEEKLIVFEDESSVVFREIHPEGATRVYMLEVVTSRLLYETG
jgi:uncharacterized protein (DUF1919 family)